MAGTSPIVIRVATLFITVFALLLSGTGSVLARQQVSSSEQPPISSYDITGDVRSLQRLLAVIGHFQQSPTGSWDEVTANALKAFQRSQDLPQTGELDEPTIAALGGSQDALDRHPRFRHVIRSGDILSALAERFGSSIPWIVRFNPSLTSIHHIAEGAEIVVPIQFPLPDSFRVERLQVLTDRFLGTYISDVSFTEVNKLEEAIAAMLERAGFNIERASTPLEGITISGRGIVLGKLVFSAQQSNGKTRVHLALLFKKQEDLEEDFKNREWIADDTVS